jgi:hypothetical protein
MWIEPFGFEQAHLRGRTEPHRLQDPSKWVPYGVGAIEGTAGQPVSALEPGSGGQTPMGAVAGSPHGSTVPETSDSTETAQARREPAFEYPPGEEPRPGEGEAKGWSNGELL